MATDISKDQLDQIITQYANIVRELVKVDAIYLFGSFAKGNAGPDSDIDLLVVSSDWTDNIIEDTMILMRARRTVDLRIEPHPIRPEELDDNPFILSLKHEMKKVV
ncbi:MAG: nucleotidyltransferase domain-containing protein [Candidatus Cloacimonadaceae bacterium]|nr:nucleotidyltransferase domain-containing protein [Candidatus Cloacimonadaceae bacterium]